MRWRAAPRVVDDAADARAGALLTRVRSRASIPVNRRALGLVEGEYGSIHAGRSLDFDDLREYIIGDDIRDVEGGVEPVEPAHRERGVLHARRERVLDRVSEDPEQLCTLPTAHP